tara:strand:+ start:830 stop:2788 length:1959 start_codon:yes stop_codon:yes gene_type:complete
MAKKSGMSLNPGADATLVAAATKAAMANVPKDLSGTFESMASEYGKTMRAVGESFATAAKDLGKIGGGLVKKAIENQGLITSGDRYTLETEIEVQDPQTEEGPVKTSGFGPRVDGLGDTDTSPKKKTIKKTTIGDELRSIRKELSSLFLKTDKKSRARKNELRAQREQFSNDIKMLDDARNITDDQLTSGNVNFQNTGKLNLAFKQGMNALGTKTGIIDDEGDFEGYKLVPSRDKNGKMGFMLKDKKGDFVTGEDENGNLITSGEKPHFVSAAETKNLLEMNMDQKILDPLQKKINAQLNFGKQNVEYMGNQLVSSFRPVLDNETTLRQLSDVRLGDDTKTLREHVNGESEYSAEIFAGLSSADLVSMGVEDANEDGFIGDNPNTKDKIETGDFVGSDVAVSNFKKVRSATFDKTNPNYDSGSHLKRLTEKHIYRVGEIMHSVGNKLYTPPKGTTTTTTNPFGTKSIQIGNTWLSANDRLARRKIIEAGKGGFTGVYGDYAPTKDGWTRDQGDGPKPINTYQMMQDEQLVVAGDVDPSIKEKEQKEANNKYSSNILTNTVKGLTDEKDIMNALKEKFKDTKFTFDYTFGDGKEIVKVKYGNGEYKKFTLSGDIGQRIADYMNQMDPKFVVGNEYERGGKNYTYNEDGTFTEK